MSYCEFLLSFNKVLFHNRLSTGLFSRHLLLSLPPPPPPGDGGSSCTLFLLIQFFICPVFRFVKVLPHELWVEEAHLLKGPIAVGERSSFTCLSFWGKGLSRRVREKQATPISFSPIQEVKGWFVIKPSWFVLPPRMIWCSQLVIYHFAVVLSLNAYWIKRYRYTESCHSGFQSKRRVWKGGIYCQVHSAHNRLWEGEKCLMGTSVQKVGESLFKKTFFLIPCWLKHGCGQGFWKFRNNRARAMLPVGKAGRLESSLRFHFSWCRRDNLTDNDYKNVYGYLEMFQLLPQCKNQKGVEREKKVPLVGGLKRAFLVQDWILKLLPPTCLSPPAKMQLLICVLGGESDNTPIIPLLEPSLCSLKMCTFCSALGLKPGAHTLGSVLQLCSGFPPPETGHHASISE